MIDPAHRIAPYNDLVKYPPDTLFQPTFLYESLYCLVAFIGLAFIAEKLKGWLLYGDVLLIYLILYPLGRFFLEYLRPDAWMIGPIAAAQLFALILIAASAVTLAVRHVLAGRAQAAPEPADEAASGAEDEVQASTESA